MRMSTCSWLSGRQVSNSNALSVLPSQHVSNIDAAAKQLFYQRLWVRVAAPAAQLCEYLHSEPTQAYNLHLVNAYKNPFLDLLAVLPLALLPFEPFFLLGTCTDTLSGHLRSDHGKLQEILTTVIVP